MILNVYMYTVYNWGTDIARIFYYVVREVEFWGTVVLIKLARWKKHIRFPCAFYG